MQKIMAGLANSELESLADESSNELRRTQSETRRNPISRAHLVLFASI